MSLHINDLYNTKDIDISSLRNWDIILQYTSFHFLKPLTWFSSSIRYLTKSIVNHTSNVVSDNWELYIYHALWWWVSKEKVSDRIKKPYDRKVVVLRRKKPVDDISYIAKNKYEYWKPYDFAWILKILLYILTWKWKDISDKCSQKSRWCSEFTARCLWMEWRQKYLPRDFLNEEEFIVVR
jgi:hypothetical protein